MTTAITTTGAELMRPEFSQEHVTLIRQMVMQSVERPPSDAEMRLFLNTCQRTGLDPLMRQIYCIERRQNKGGQWVSKFETQLSIDGMRLVAERTDRYEGQVGPYWCGADGEWRDVWVQEAAPVAAKVGVWKRGFREPLWAVALYSEYAQTTRDKQSGRDVPTRFWQRMPALMLAKCAESLALRKAFPHELSGLYTREEMSQAESDEAAYHAPAAVPAGMLPATINGANLKQAEWETRPSTPAPRPPVSAAAKPASEVMLNEIGRLRMDLDWSKAQLAQYIRSEGFDPARLNEREAGQVIDWLVIKVDEYQETQRLAQEARQSTLTDEDAIEAAIAPRNGAAGVAR
jgi:phage recombination protein Bet